MEVPSSQSASAPVATITNRVVDERRILKGVSERKTAVTIPQRGCKIQEPGKYGEPGDF
jgi:hypothetical protein